MSTWSTLATSTCCRPRLVRLSTPWRGSMRSMIPSSAPSGRTHTRSPAATTCRWSVDERLEQPPRGAAAQRAVVELHGAVRAPARAARGPGGKPSGRSPAARWRRRVVLAHLGVGDGALAGQIALAADALPRRGVVERRRRSGRAPSRPNSCSRARTLRFLRKSARTWRFFLDMEAVGCQLSAIGQRMHSIALLALADS